MLAHLLTGSPVPLAFQWLAAFLLFGGGLGALAVHQRGWRIVATGVACAGLGGIVSSWVLAAAQPGAPPYTIRVVTPSSGARVASPLVLTVCGVRPDGSKLPATDAQHYLVVFVDGREVPTVDAWQFAEVVTPGRHTIRVELVSPMHHAFSPAAIATTIVTVTQDAPSVAGGAC